MKSEERKSYEKSYKQAYAKTHRQITVTVSNSVYRDFEQRANAEKTKVATLVKNMAMAYLQQDTLTPAKIETELSDLKFLIRNIANNVNQMAHHSNMLQTMVDENELLGELKKLEQQVNDYTHERLKR